VNAATKYRPTLLRLESRVRFEVANSLKDAADYIEQVDEQDLALKEVDVILATLEEIYGQLSAVRLVLKTVVEANT
jgi:hypothetical protein